MARRVDYDPLVLPAQDASLRSGLPQLQTFFKIWDGVLEANYGVVDNEGKFLGNRGVAACLTEGGITMMVRMLFSFFPRNKISTYIGT
jgi:hypothetical protein